MKNQKPVKQEQSKTTYRKRISNKKLVYSTISAFPKKKLKTATI